MDHVTYNFGLCIYLSPLSFQLYKREKIIIHYKWLKFILINDWVMLQCTYGCMTMYFLAQTVDIFEK